MSIRKRNTSPKVIMITGAAGYIGAMLCDQFSKSPDLEKIVAVDMHPQPELLKDNKKIIWITANLYQNVWRVPALINRPEVIIHAAWQTNEVYGKPELQNKLNTESTAALFEFAFKNSFVRKVIFLSDILAYGPHSELNGHNLYTEKDELIETEYTQAYQKAQMEILLRELYDSSDKSKQVFVLRSGKIFGPRGRSINSIDFLPVATHGLLFQFIHEDDITDIIAMFTFSELKKLGTYEIYNLCAGDFVNTDMVAEIFKKKMIILPPLVIKFVFFVLWRLLGGKISTGPGVWQFYSYPYLTDGSKITKAYGFEYTYKSSETLAGGDGRYAPVL